MENEKQDIFVRWISLEDGFITIFFLLPLTYQFVEVKTLVIWSTVGR